MPPIVHENATEQFSTSNDKVLPCPSTNQLGVAHQPIPHFLAELLPGVAERPPELVSEALHDQAFSFAHTTLGRVAWSPIGRRDEFR